MDRLCPALEGDGEAELAAMRKELEAMVLAQKDISKYGDSGSISKNEEKHLNFLKNLPSPSTMLWKHWLSLVGRSANKKDLTHQAYVEELTALGLRVFGLPQFRRDVELLILGTFRFAAEAMKSFTEAKQNSGVVDFADMERMARQALGNPKVQERLKGRFRVLFVDEFQDTSPIQLSIFHLLGQLIHGTEEAPGRIMYVGDAKQSIYGFRGASPELTARCTPRPLWEEIVLPVCWRSVPELCDFTNRFFREVEDEELRNSLLGPLAAGQNVEGLLNIESVLEAEDYQAQKAPLRRSLGGIESLRFWLTDKAVGAKGKLRKKDVFASLARNIAGLCGKVGEDGRILPDMDKGRAARVSKIAKIGNRFSEGDLGTRPVEPGDIAVLCRSNKDCVAIADALEELGIKAAANREGLLEQDDVNLCLNAFRLALDPEDKLAAAELHLALNGGDAWFETARKSRGEVGSLWEGIPFMENIEALHKRLNQLTPAELLDETLSAADCFRLASARSRREERFADLEALRALVREYEQAMHSRRSSATAQGWLDWLKEREPDRASGGQDAVQVWTYHKSKGLERKVVILHSLSDPNAKVDIFQPRAFGTPCPEKDPLEGRTLEWIPNVFGGAAELLEEKDGDAFFTSRKEAFRKELREESQRLLYVGMTRACDVLILTASLAGKGTKVSSPWLEPFLNGKTKAGKRDALAELSDIATAEDGTTAEFRGKTFRVTRMVGIEPAVWASLQKGEELALFPLAPEKAGEKQKEGAKGTGRLSPVAANWLPFPAPPTDQSAINPDAPRDQLGNMLHGWFAVWFGMNREQREAERASGRMERRLERFCTLWNEAFALWPDAAEHLPAMSDALEQAVQDWFDKRKDKRPGDELILRTEWPLEHRLEESANGVAACRLDSMRVDLMAEVRRADGTNGPCLIIDHKCGSYKGRPDLKEHLTESYGQRQSDYMRALHDMGRECSCWLHLPLEGRMLEFTLNENEA